FHGAVRLRPPRAARLPIARRRDAEDAFHIVITGLFAAIELSYAVVPAERGQVHRRRRMDAVPVRMKADLVFLERFDDVIAAAALEAAGPFADDLEDRADQFTGQETGEAQRRVIAGREDVVLGVEP